MATAADAAPSRFRPGVPPGVCGGQLPRGSSHRHSGIPPPPLHPSVSIRVPPQDRPRLEVCRPVSILGEPCPLQRRPPALHLEHPLIGRGPRPPALLSRIAASWRSRRFPGWPFPDPPSGAPLRMSPTPRSCLPRPSSGIDPPGCLLPGTARHRWPGLSPWRPSRVVLPGRAGGRIPGRSPYRRSPRSPRAPWRSRRTIAVAEALADTRVGTSGAGPFPGRRARPGRHPSRGHRRPRVLPSRPTCGERPPRGRTGWGAGTASPGPVAASIHIATITRSAPGRASGGPGAAHSSGYVSARGRRGPRALPGRGPRRAGPSPGGVTPRYSAGRGMAPPGQGGYGRGHELVAPSVGAPEGAVTSRYSRGGRPPARSPTRAPPGV